METLRPRGTPPNQLRNCASAMGLPANPDAAASSVALASMTRFAATIYVKSPGAHFASLIASPGRQKAMFGCGGAFNDHPATFLQLDDPAHDCRTIRVAPATHPEGQIAGCERNSRLASHCQPCNRDVYSHSQRVVGIGNDQRIRNQEIGL